MTSQRSTFALSTAVAFGLASAAITALSAGAQAAESRRITKVPEAVSLLTARSLDLPSMLPGALGLDAQSSLAVRATRPLPNGQGSTVRLDQTYRGIPIWGHQVVVELSPKGEIAYARGAAVFGIDGAAAAPAPALGSADVLGRVKDIVARESSPPFKLTYRNEVSQLTYYLLGDDLRLTYRVSFYTDLRDRAGNPRPTRPVYFIDANTGEVVANYENIQHVALGTGPGGNARTGQWTWGSDAIHPKFQIQKSGATCTLDDGATVFSENLNHAVDPNGGEAGTMTPFSFACYNNTFQTINGGFSPLNDAQSFGLALYKMYKTWFGVAPITQKLWLRVHYGNSYENAFWNGDSMAFGDGASTFYPLVGLDVTGHEISHGFTEQNSGLIYDKQSGGMNEAYSDMAGETLEAYYFQTFGAIFPRAMPDYLVGAEVFKASGQALRYMCNPPLDGGSIDLVRNFYYPLDVHYTSGVYNKAFCLLAKTAGWGPKKAFNVFFTANKNYWTPNETYRTGYEAVVQAATVLHYNVADVVAAFQAVGIVPIPTHTGNDNFANAATIRGWKSVMGDNTGATKETGEPTIIDGAGKTVWWKCVATTSLVANIDTLGSNIDTSLAVFTGTAVNALSLVLQNGDINGNDSDHGGNWASRVTFSTTAGTTYRIAVDNYPNPSVQGEIRLNLTNLGCAGDRHDFDGDTKSDILWRHVSGQALISRFDGVAISSETSLGTVATAWRVAAVGDFDGDGKADILWQKNTGEVQLWEMDGAVKKLVHAVQTLPAPWTIVAAADFDGDGKADILWRNPTTGETAVWIMDGYTATAKVDSRTIPTTWQLVGVGDFDGDGRADIAWRNSSTGVVQAWLMNGGDAVTVKNIGNKSSDWLAVGVGDFNGDGKFDLLWHHPDNNTLSIWQMDGTDVTAMNFFGRNHSNVSAVRDFDGDGKADVLWHDTAGGVWLWPMDGKVAKSKVKLGLKGSNWQVQ